MIDIDKISEEHKKLFPEASLESQILKMEEETLELRGATRYKDIVKEYADCVIVCAGLYRWCPNFALFLLHLLYLENKTNSPLDMWGDIEDEVIRKWAVNLGRTWEFKNGVYHHVGKDGNE